jgi:glycosyl transferase family 25
MDMEKKIGIDHIYVVHALQGHAAAEKRKRLEDILGGRYGMDFEFASDGDPSKWTEEMIYTYFSSDIREKLSRGAISCALNHILLYERMVERGDQLALVFEDDAFFINRFEKRIADMVKEACQLEPGFIVSLENSTLKFPSRKQMQKGKFLYPAQTGRCAGAYLVDQTAARDMLDVLKTNKCTKVIDWWHSEITEQGVIKMYWAHPPVVEQGSHNGKMHSNLSSTAQSLFRRVSWILQKYYKTYFLRLFKK